jgi:hypothetical protein
MSDFRNFLQGASNSAASGVSAPVDVIAWLMRKAGMGGMIGNAPVGGSDWMAQKGLTADAPGKAGLLGEAIGGVVPLLGAAKAPQIAGGLLSTPARSTPPGPVSVTNEEALAMVRGKTEKPGGTDPTRLLGAGIKNGREYTLEHVPLSAVRPNEAGDLYDGTVGRALAESYAKRPAVGKDVPPVILLSGPRTKGVLNVMDGGHRVTAARMRGDETILALVSRQ